MMIQARSRGKLECHNTSSGQLICSVQRTRNFPAFCTLAGATFLRRSFPSPSLREVNTIYLYEKIK